MGQYAKTAITIRFGATISANNPYSRSGRFRALAAGCTGASGRERTDCPTAVLLLLVEVGVTGGKLSLDDGSEQCKRVIFGGSSQAGPGHRHPPAIHFEGRATSRLPHASS